MYIDILPLRKKQKRIIYYYNSYYNYYYCRCFHHLPQHTFFPSSSAALASLFIRFFFIFIYVFHFCVFFFFFCFLTSLHCIIYFNGTIDSFHSFGVNAKKKIRNYKISLNLVLVGNLSRLVEEIVCLQNKILLVNYFFLFFVHLSLSYFNCLVFGASDYILHLNCLRIKQ